MIRQTSGCKGQKATWRAQRRVAFHLTYFVKTFAYDAQQAVEKAFKSICIIHEIVFPKTHDIAYLIELLEKGGVEVPENLQNSKILTGYAVETRYPGDYEPVDEEDLRKAIEIAKEVLKWVKKEMDKGQRPPDPQKSLFE